MTDPLEKSPLEKYSEAGEEAAAQRTREHSTPRLDAFRARLPGIPTSRLIAYISDYHTHESTSSEFGWGSCAPLLCREVLVPYRDHTKG